MRKAVVFFSVVFVLLMVAAFSQQQPGAQAPKAPQAPPAPPALEKSQTGQTEDWGEVRAMMTCIRNLHQLQRAKDEWGAQHNAKQGDPAPAMEELVGVDKPLKAKPECPKGGTYTLGPIGEPVKCSVHGTADEAMKQWRDKAEQTRLKSEPERVCFGNLRMIKSAADQWGSEHSLQKGAKLPSLETLFEKRQFLKDRIKCPSGGSYSISAYGEDPTCSVHKSLTELQNKLAPDIRRSPVEGVGQPSPEQSKMRCMMNLGRLNRAVEQWAKEKNLKPGDAGPTVQDISGPGKMLPRTLQCPSGGTYKLGKIGELPECSIHGKFTEQMSPMTIVPEKKQEPVKPAATNP
jgi:hypothetical protein